MQDVLQGLDSDLVRAPEGLRLERKKNILPLFFKKKIKYKGGMGYLSSKCKTLDCPFYLDFSKIHDMYKKDYHLPITVRMPSLWALGVTSFWTIKFGFLLCF